MLLTSCKMPQLNFSSSASFSVTFHPLSHDETAVDAIITKLRQDKTRATNATVDALPPEVRSAAARCDITLVFVCAPGDRGAKGIGRTQERTRLRRTSRPRLQWSRPGYSPWRPSATQRDRGA